MKIRNFLAPILAFMCCSCEQKPLEAESDKKQEASLPFAGFELTKTGAYLRDLEKVRSLRIFITTMQFETFKQEYYLRDTFHDFDLMESILQNNIGEELYKQMNENMKNQKGFRPHEDVMPQPTDWAIKDPSVEVK